MPAMSTTSLSPTVRYLHLSFLLTESVARFGGRKLKTQTVVLEPRQWGGGGGQISYSLYLRQSQLANVFPVNTGLHNNLFRLDSGVGRGNVPAFRAR